MWRLWEVNPRDANEARYLELWQGWSFPVTDMETV